jgi:hypothetical protein
MQSSEKAGRLTRRQFVAVGAIGGAAFAIGCTARKQGNWDFLSEGQARTLAAICDRIIPSDDFPSASEAGVVSPHNIHWVKCTDCHQHGIPKRKTPGPVKAQSLSMIGRNG